MFERRTQQLCSRVRWHVQRALEGKVYTHSLFRVVFQRAPLCGPHVLGGRSEGGKIQDGEKPVLVVYELPLRPTTDITEHGGNHVTLHT